MFVCKPGPSTGFSSLLVPLNKLLLTFIINKKLQTNNINSLVFLSESN